MATRTNDKNPWRSLPAAFPSWLMRRPELIVAGLSVRNIYRRNRLLAPLSAVAVGAAIWAVSTHAFDRGVELCAGHPAVIVLLATLHTGTWISRAKVRIEANRARSWLTPLPCGLPGRAQLLLAPGLQLVTLSLVLAICLAKGQVRSGSVATVLLAVTAGFAIGSLIGALNLRFSRASKDSWRYALVRPVRIGWATNPGLQPLSYWAVAQGRVFFNPRMLVAALGPVLFAIPMGRVGVATFAIFVSWCVLLYAVLLLAAAVRVASRAARWLSPTGIPWHRFMLHVGYRIVILQAVACAVALLFCTALAPSAMLRLEFGAAAVWMAFVLAIILASCGLAFRRVG